MSNERLYRSLYAKCLRYLGMRLRSEREVRDKLAGWIEEAYSYGHPGVSDIDQVADSSMVEYVSQERQPENPDNELLGKVIDQLKREKFLDDGRFAREWIISRLKRGKRGPAVIKMELRQKGISGEIIDAAMQDVEQEEVGISEEEGAKQAAEKYMRKLDGRDEREQKAKLYAYLRGKGFSNSIVAGIMKELF